MEDAVCRILFFICYLLVMDMKKRKPCGSRWFFWTVKKKLARKHRLDNLK